MTELDGQLLANIAGVVGVALYIGAYALLQIGVIRGQSYIYPLLNSVAAGFILISLAQSFNLASAVIQGAWIVISIVGIVRVFILSRRIRFSDEEQTFLNNKMPELPRLAARRFFDSGLWCELEPGTIVTRVDAPVDRLVYIADGEAAVAVEGATVARVRSDSLIGELTSLTGEPATATATISTLSRCFCIDAPNLRALSEKQPELRQAIERLVSDEMRKKIVAMNAVGASSHAADPDEVAETLLPGETPERDCAG